jgi:hypothetical protein
VKPLVPLISLLALAVLAAPPAPPAAADTNYPELDHVASVLAMRPVQIDCPDQTDWNADSLAAHDWDYVIFYGGQPADSARVDPLICSGALAIPGAAAGQPTGLDDWQLAIAVLIIAHESYHLRKWSLNADEAAVECRAIRHFTTTVQLLGGTHALAERLLPWALAFHFRMAALHPEYRSPRCKPPWPY